MLEVLGSHLGASHDHSRLIGNVPRDAFQQERSSSGKLAYAQHCASNKRNFNSYLARDFASIGPALL